MPLSLWSLTALFVLVVYGCATTGGNPSIQDPAIISQIKIGESTKADVTRLLGEPNYRSTTHINNLNTEVWAYGYAKHETNPWIYVPIVGLFAMSFGGLGEHQSAGFSVSFDQEGIVRARSKMRSDITMGGLTTPTKVESQSDTQSGEAGGFRFDHKSSTTTNP